MLDAINPAASATSPSATTGVGATTSARAAASSAESAPADFGAMLGQLAADAVGSLRNAEALSLAGVRGQAGVHQVVEAVMAAEQTLQGAIAVRDKVVGAYMEISRMQI